MSEVQPGSAKPDLLKWAIMGVALIGVAAVLYVIGGALFKPASSSTDLSQFKTGALAKLNPTTAPAGLPDNEFVNDKGEPLSMAAFKGKVTVLNFWATWCAPCKLELPSLGRLQSAYAPSQLTVVAISIDKPNLKPAILEELAKAPPLAFYNDETGAMPFRLKSGPAMGVPTTIIYDKHGRERARLEGGADWSGPDARRLIDHLLAED
ncbi:thiol-disulfide isomerase/thioredoxin [Caulobacter ginsengisoli]|uniref:Thiol-disulfide isomerase/thioredoxin n=1 Tax=Caulobacter ginsengisoli TaxID=400775 RepID=A0ABU0IV20_9CAUL|nr:TlpA disulfide reductase family protein [Caulobacter ginsengisoli]MDQ0465865.1 thiol-disulfide isomerase/thioredoxin [Caulobacter ginsengisoli]